MNRLHTLCDDLLSLIVSYCDGLDVLRLHASSRVLRWAREPVRSRSEATYERYGRLCTIFGTRFVQRFRWTRWIVAVAETPWSPEFASPTGYCDRVRNVDGIARSIRWGCDPEGRAFLALDTNFGTFTVFQRFNHTKRTWAIGENLLSAFRTSTYWMERGHLLEPRVPQLIETLLSSSQPNQGSSVRTRDGLNLHLT